MAAIGIIFGSNGGNAEYIAQKLVREFGKNKAIACNSNKVTLAQLKDCSYLIFGCCTWTDGSLQEDMEKLINKLSDKDLKGKKVALFTIANQLEYPQTFANAIGHLYNKMEEARCNICGYTLTEGYQYSNSNAIINGQFAGLVIDEVNQPHLSLARLKNWVTELKTHFI